VAPWDPPGLVQRTIGYRLACIDRKRLTIDLCGVSRRFMRAGWSRQEHVVRDPQPSVTQLGVAASIVSRLRCIEMAAVRVSEERLGWNLPLASRCCSVRMSSSSQVRPCIHRKRLTMRRDGEVFLGWGLFRSAPWDPARTRPKTIG
jgi:hypothetical protein